MGVYKIIAICQVFNEIEKGNLERFFTHLEPLVDGIVAYDDGSYDGSYEFLCDHTIHVIKGLSNDFQSEVEHRKQLVDFAVNLKPDFILWLDVDEVLTKCNRESLDSLCQLCIDRDLDGLQCHELNLWRSGTWRRTDSLYDDGWFTRLWRVSDAIKYNKVNRGLHQASLVPPGIKKVEKTNVISVLHYGFASEASLAEKYLRYKAIGQRGYEMLDRIIDEKTLQLEKVDREIVPDDLWILDEQKPYPYSLERAFLYIENYKKREKIIDITIVCLIYKSIEWAKFLFSQYAKYCKNDSVEFYFIVNDGEQQVKDYLNSNHIPHYIFSSTEEQKAEWYINRVYRAYNYGAKLAKGNKIVFINSDMAFSDGWLEELLLAYDGKNCVSPRLVESGRLRSGQFGIEKNFGFTPERYNENAFKRYVHKVKRNIVANGGLYMPLLIAKKDFFNAGGYPEGNVRIDSIKKTPEIIKQGEPHITGDKFLISKLELNGIKHQTSFSSIVYHFQMGEYLSNDELKPVSNNVIALCNDLTTGTMGERVFWDHFLDGIQGSIGVDRRSALNGSATLEKRIARTIKRKYPSVEIIVQNATFIKLIDPKKYTIVFLQDNLRAMGKESRQQEQTLLLADRIVANSITTAASYSDFEVDIIPIGLDDKLFRPMVRDEQRKYLNINYDGPIGIFVGALNETKGWLKVKECIDSRQDIKWIVVSKYDEQYNASNVISYKKVNQETLARLLASSNFFILGSPVETQCLAAIEACLCDIPVIMNKTGIFSEFSDEELNNCGLFSQDFAKSIDIVLSRTFSPRNTIIARSMTISSCIEKWEKILVDAKKQVWAISNKERIREKRKMRAWYSYYYPKTVRIVYGIIDMRVIQLILKLIFRAQRKIRFLISSLVELLKKMIKGKL